MITTNKQYFNEAQQFMIAMNPHDLIAVCGRGFGKGAVQAARLTTGYQGMPGSTGGFVGPSVKRVMTNILPSLFVHLEKWGYHRDVHYIVGKKPWKALHWKNPLFTPANWENTISFYNGSVCNIISQDRLGTSNSMSLDYVIVDEAKFINPEQLRNETFPANRGNEMYFGKFFMHHGMTITSDMPVTKKGSWFLSYEDEMDTDIVSTLWFVVRKINHINKEIEQQPEKKFYYRDELEKWTRMLLQLRRDCLLYCEFSSLENIDILTEDYVRRMKRELSSQTFNTAVLNRKQRVRRDGFYGGMDEDVNLYTAPNTSRLILEHVGTDKIKDDCRLDNDLDAAQPICIAFDANLLFNCLVAGQPKNGKLRVLKSFFVKYDRKLPELVDDFCDYYQYHRNKRVVFYFDATFKYNLTGVKRAIPYVIIETQFRKRGWNVTRKYIGKPMGHIEKAALINEMFKGMRNYMVLINRDNNENLIISIESAAVYNGKKDKSGEKDVETEEDVFENRTDFSDAFDTLCIGVELFPVFTGHDAVPNYYPK